MGHSKALFVVVTERDPLNIRTGPGKHFSKIGSLPSGTIVMGEDVGGWARATMQGETCYLSMDYLQPFEPPGVLCYTADDIKQVISWLEGLL